MLLAALLLQPNVVVSLDHFVALPSGRSLSVKGTGNCTARICKTDNSRCEYAPRDSRCLLDEHLSTCTTK
jgi:hypothetical protein